MKDFIANNFVPVVGSAMMLVFVLRNDKMTKIRKRFFVATLFIFVASVIFRNADFITSNYETFTIRRQFYSALGYIFRVLMVYGLIGTDLQLQNKASRRLYTLLGIPVLITAISAFSVFFTDQVYHFNRDTNGFESGPLSWLNYASLFIYIGAFCIIVIDDLKKKRYRHAVKVIVTLLLMSSGILFEYFSFREFMSETAVTMALMMYFFFFQSDEFTLERRKLEYKAMRDGLTGLYNRAGYEALIAELAEEKDLMIAVMVLDIDKFKEVNDTYGHETGDVILKQVAKLLKVTFRSTDYVIRYGGDEFVVIMAGITENLAFVVQNKIESVNVQLENPISNIPKTSVSAGLCFGENGFTQELFTKADKALYYTKTTTRRACSVYSDEMETAPSENGV